MTSPLCSCCGCAFPLGSGGDHLCASCLGGVFHFSKARSVLAYSKPVAKALHGFKYGGSHAGLVTFGALFAQVLPNCSFTAMADLILPVPLHPKRLRERGFNQSLLLAKAFFPSATAEIRHDILERVRHTSSQTGLNRDERRKNVARAISVRGSKEVRGKRVMLVDDVYTTGATINESARVLKKAGALSVEVVTLVRVVLGSPP